MFNVVHPVREMEGALLPGATAAVNRIGSALENTLKEKLGIAEPWVHVAATAPVEVAGELVSALELTDTDAAGFFSVRVTGTSTSVVTFGTFRCTLAV